MSAAVGRSTSCALSVTFVLHARVMIPVAVIKLDEPHAALGQPPRQQAVRRKRSVARLRAVHVEHSSAAPCDMSTRSGTLVCIRNAISYCAMRVRISGSASALFRMRLSALTASIDLAGPARVIDPAAS